jgi:hypothetical protein
MFVESFIVKFPKYSPYLWYGEFRVGRLHCSLSAWNSKFKTYNELCSKAVCARQGKNNFPLGLLEAQMPLVHRLTS